MGNISVRQQETVQPLMKWAFSLWSFSSMFHALYESLCSSISRDVIRCRANMLDSVCFKESLKSCKMNWGPLVLTNWKWLKISPSCSMFFPAVVDLIINTSGHLLWASIATRIILSSKGSAKSTWTHLPRCRRPSPGMKRRWWRYAADSLTWWACWGCFLNMPINTWLPEVAFSKPLHANHTTVARMQLLQQLPSQGWRDYYSVSPQQTLCLYIFGVTRQQQSPSLHASSS